MRSILTKFQIQRDKLNTWNTLQTGLVCTSLFIVISIWLLVFQRVEYEKQNTLEAATVSNKTLNFIVAENISQLMNRSEIYKLIAINWFNVNQVEAEAKILAILASDPVFTRVAIFNQDGSLGFATSPSSSDNELKPFIRDLVAMGQSNPSSSMKVGEISPNLFEAWQLPLLIPILNQETQNGAVLIVVDLGYALNLYLDIDIGESGVIHLLNNNGKELVRVKRGGLEILSSKWNNLGVNQYLQKESWVGQLAIDGYQRIVSLKNASPYPFSILVSREIKEVLSDHDSLSTKYYVVLCIFSSILIGAAFWLIKLIQTQKISFALLETSELEKSHLIKKLEIERSMAIDVASKDHLTGLYNRRIFMELGSSHLTRSKRSRKFSAVIFIDLDRFKSINDSLGHHIGDLLLKTIGTKLKQLLRESDIVSRFGGDEFVVMLTELEKEQDVVEITEKIVIAISAPCLDLDGHNLQILPSIGVAISPRDGQDLSMLIRHADLAMYQSKQSKSGSYTFFDPSLNSSNVLQFELEQRFNSAIANDEFVLHFQPKVEIGHYEIVGLEALVRWNHPEHGLIFPNDFIPLAENTGHIVELGMWVIKAACRQVSVWKERNIPIVPIAVNISAQQLKDKYLINHLNDCINRYGLTAQDIEIEITESCLIENFDSVKAKLKLIKASGIKIALDDFGNGFSSLSYIKTLPIDIIKIDRAFISDIKNNHDDAIIVNSTITLAHNLGKKIIAEGVETIEQLVHLKTAGCDQVQGYYFSRPLDVQSIEKLLIEKTLEPQ